MYLLINRIIIVLALTAVVFIPHELEAVNSVDIEMTSHRQHDTLWINGLGDPVPATFDIYIENDIGLGGISLGFKIWTPDEAGWEYRDVSDSFALPDSEFNYLSVVPGSRLDPPNEAFDLTGLLITEKSMDGQNHDTIQIGGISIMDSLPPGPREHMMSIHFNPEVPGWQSHICFDTTFVPPSGNFVFVDTKGHTFAPDILWEYGSKCWVVANAPIYNNGKVTVEPDTINARDAYSGEPKTVIIRVGFSWYEAEDIATVHVNYSLDLTPLSTSIIDSFPGYSGSVLEMIFDMSDFILTYDDLWWGTTMQFVRVSGYFYDGNNMDLDTYHIIPAIGLTPGDANGDDIANVGDVVRIIDYLERGGAVPVPWETADADGNGTVQMADVVYLINYIFRHGPPPNHP